MAKKQQFDVQTLLKHHYWIVAGLAGMALPVFWYLAYRYRYYWSHTSFQAARFRSTVTAGKLLWLWVSNLLLIVVTLGIAIPWVLARNVRFNLANITLIGSLDLSSVVQEAQQAGAGAESLAGMLNIDFAGFDLPF